MEDTNEAKVLEQPKAPRLKLPFKWTELAFLAVIIIASAALALHLVSTTHTNQEIHDAKQLGGQVVTALAKQNTAKLRSLGDKDFQTNNTASKLDSELTFKTTPPITFGAMYGDTKPTIDIHMALNNVRGQHVVFIYRYDKLKVPFYVRVDTIKPPHSTHWYLQALSAGADESNLTNPLPAGAASA